jgi:hypothetical protein
MFAGYWPHQEGGEDDEIARLFNRVPKYVASGGRPDLSGPAPGSSAPIWPAPCARSGTGTST